MEWRRFLEVLEEAAESLSTTKTALNFSGGHRVLLWEKKLQICGLVIIARCCAEERLVEDGVRAEKAPHC